MANPNDAYIRALRLHSRPFQTGRDEQPLRTGDFVDEKSYPEHLSTRREGGGGPDHRVDDLENARPASAARNSPFKLSKAPSPQGSPTRPSSKGSFDVQSGLKASSLRADAGSSPSRGSTSDDDLKARKTSTKRQRDEGTHGRISRIRTRTAPPKKPSAARLFEGKTARLLAPEDVDDNFKRRSPAEPQSHMGKPVTASAKASPDQVPSSTPTLSMPTPVTTGSTASQAVSQAPHHAAALQHPAALQRPVGLHHPGMVRLKFKTEWPGLVLQPESREISQEQLAAEVKSIYTGLTMVETKCIHIDKLQAATPRSESKITDEHWQAMIALHRTLLHEHHDFFLASQHPSASAALKRLAVKYSMPARMWKHGIHSFLELLRHRLPESLEYMLAFIYLAYQMMALLYETVDSFRTTWVECLGDLGRYRMAVEDEDIRDREIWAGVARSWYNKAADTNPAVGRLWHHLAILARPYMAQQLYLYNRSLTSIVPFLNARESIVTIFDPVLAPTPKVDISQVDLRLLKIHALLFKKQDLDLVKSLSAEYLDLLDPSITQIGVRWREVGVHTAVAIIGAIFGFGDQTNTLRIHSDNYRKRMQLQDPSCTPAGLPEDQSIQDTRSLPPPDELTQTAVMLASELFSNTLRVALFRQDDKNVLSLIHTGLAFANHLYELRAHSDDNIIEELLTTFQWHALATYLNTLLRSEDNIDPDFADSILFDADGRPLPEDWMLRGLTFTFGYYPAEWFKDAAETEEEERYMEGLTSTMKARLDRVLSLAVHISKIGSHLQFNRASRRFAASSQDMDMDEGYYSVAGDDSAEMKEANRDDARIRSPFQATTTDKLGRTYSSIIADVDVLRDGNLFEAVRKLQLPVIIPEEAITELVILEKGRSVGSNEAAAALSNIRSAVYDLASNIRIETADGRDVTTRHIESPTAAAMEVRRFYADQIPTQSDLRKKTLGESLGKIIRRETDFSTISRRTDTSAWSKASRQSTFTDITAMDEDHDANDKANTVPIGAATAAAAGSTTDRAKPLLISDNKVFRATAGEFGAAAIAGWMLKKWIVQTKKHSTSMSTSTSETTVAHHTRKTANNDNTKDNTKDNANANANAMEIDTPAPVEAPTSY